MSRKTGKVLQENALWGFGRKIKSSTGRVRLKLRWGRIGFTFSVLALAGWFFLAAMLYFFFKTRRGYDEVQYTKMLVLPFRYADHRREMGDFYIRKAVNEMEERNFRGAMLLLRAGVNLAPNNQQGRLLLSEFYEFAQNRPDLAVDILRGGLAFAEMFPEFHSREYLQRVFRAYIANALDDDAYQLATELMPDFEGDKEMTQLLAYVAALSRVFRGGFGEARQLLQDNNLLESPDGVALEARILWLQGNKRTAFNLLDRALLRFPGNDALRDMAVQFHFEEEDFERARQISQLRLRNNPDNLRARIELAQALGRLGRTEAMMREVEVILKEARGDRNTLLIIAALASDAKDIALAQRMIRQARQGAEVDLDLFYSSLAALAAAGEYQQAWDSLNDFLRNPPPDLDRGRVFQLGLQSFLALGLGRDAESARFFREMLQTNFTRPEVYVGLARLFSGVGAYDQAFQLLDFSNRQRRDNRAVLQALVKLQIDHDVGERLPEHISQLLALRRPGHNLLSETFSFMGSDRFLFHPLRAELLQRLSRMLEA
jgi:tetratricopeptide (TPR) repeat protein